MVSPIFESAIAGLNQASGRFERSATEVTRLGGAYSAAQRAATVQVSPEAQGPAPVHDSESKGTLEGALVDTRIAKYQFIANLRVLRTGEEMAGELSKLGRK